MQEDLWGKGSVAFWGEAGEGCLLKKQVLLLPCVGMGSFAFQVDRDTLEILNA